MNLIPKFLRKNYPPVIVNPSTFRGVQVAGLSNLGILSTKTCDTRTIEGQRNAYMYCPAVTAIINYKVGASCNAEFHFINDKDEKVKSNFEKLIRNPNANQNWIQFWQFAKTMQQIFGKAYIYVRNLPGISTPSEMHVIPNWELTINAGQTAWGADRSGFGSNIISYQWQHNGQQITIMPADVLIMNDTSIDIGNINGEYTQGQSRLLPLGDAVQNIIAAYEARNMLLTNGGPPVILSPDGKDTVGHMPMSPKDKDEAEQKLLQPYGYTRGKKLVAFATNPMKATFIGKNPNDLAAFEEVEADLLEICRGYGVPAYIFGLDSATYANLLEAKKSMYQETTIPETASDLSAFVQYFSMKENFVAEFEHVEALQKSENDKIDTFSKLVTALGIALDKGLISKDEARTVMNENESIDFDFAGSAPEIEQPNINDNGNS